MGKPMRSYPSDDFYTEYLNRLTTKNEKLSLLLRFGVESGLRISDILKIRAAGLKRTFSVSQTKTKTSKPVTLSAKLYWDLRNFIKANELTGTDFLFFSAPYRKDKALHRTYVHKVLKAMATELGAESIGPHSMRKQYAKEVYKATGSIEAVQKAMQHKNINTTLHYFVDMAKLKGLIEAAII